MAEVPAPARRPLRFGSFELDLQSGELRKAGVLLGLQEQSVKVLVELLARPGNWSLASTAPATVAQRDVCRLRARSERRHQPPARDAGRFRGLTTLHSDRASARIPLHCQCRGRGCDGGGGARRTDQRHSRSAGESVKPAAETDRSIDRDRRGWPHPHGRDHRAASQNSHDR